MRASRTLAAADSPGPTLTMWACARLAGLDDLVGVGDDLGGGRDQFRHHLSVNQKHLGSGAEHPYTARTCWSPSSLPLLSQPSPWPPHASPPPHRSRYGSGGAPGAHADPRPPAPPVPTVTPVTGRSTHPLPPVSDFPPEAPMPLPGHRSTTIRPSRSIAAARSASPPGSACPDAARLALRLHAGGGAGVAGDRRRQRTSGGTRVGRTAVAVLTNGTAGARSRRRRTGGGAARDGGQGAAVQSVRRHRRRADLRRGPLGRRARGARARRWRRRSAGSTWRTSRAPTCFEVERRLQDAVDIPVFHDDQHGTAIVVAAAVLNAAR